MIHLHVNTQNIYQELINRAYEIRKADFLEAVNDSDVSLFQSTERNRLRHATTTGRETGRWQAVEAISQCIVIQLRSVLLFVQALTT